MSIRTMSVAVRLASLVYACLWSSCASQPSPTMCMSSGAKLPFGKATREAYFQFDTDYVNFNHGGFGGTPKPVRAAMEAATNQMEASPTEFFSIGYHSMIEEVRPRIGDLLRADSADIVFLDDASAGLNAVLRSFPWKKGDTLLLTSAAYALLPNAGQWLEARYGIRIVTAMVPFPCESAADFLAPVRQALEEVAANGSQVRLAVFDHVASYPPVIVPVRELADLVKSVTNKEALVLVDGAHAVGQEHEKITENPAACTSSCQVDINLTALASAGVDVYIGNGHKWLMAPHGSGVLWARPSVQPMLEPAIISSANPPGTPFQARFDYIGTRDYTPWCSIGAALDFRRDHLGGEDCVQNYTVGLGRWMAAELAKRFRTEAVAPPSMTPAMASVRLPIPLHWNAHRQAKCATVIGQGLMTNTSLRRQLVSFSLPRKDDPSLHSHWIRVSAQVYLDGQDVTSLAERILELAASCGSDEVDVVSPELIFTL